METSQKISLGIFAILTIASIIAMFAFVLPSLDNLHSKNSNSENNSAQISTNEQVDKNTDNNATTQDNNITSTANNNNADTTSSTSTPEPIVTEVLIPPPSALDQIPIGQEQSGDRKCPHCGLKNRPTATFCSYCGVQIPR